MTYSILFSTCFRPFYIILCFFHIVFAHFNSSDAFSDSFLVAQTHSSSSSKGIRSSFQVIEMPEAAVGSSSQASRMRWDVATSREARKRSPERPRPRKSELKRAMSCHFHAISVDFLHLFDDSQCLWASFWLKTAAYNRALLKGNRPQSPPGAA